MVEGLLADHTGQIHVTFLNKSTSKHPAQQLIKGDIVYLKNMIARKVVQGGHSHLFLTNDTKDYKDVPQKMEESDRGWYFDRLGEQNADEIYVHYLNSKKNQ